MYIHINSTEIFISFLQVVWTSLKFEGDVNNMMTAMWRLFKQYAFCHVQQEYHLWPQIFSAASEVEHKWEALKLLLKDGAYLTKGWTLSLQCYILSESNLSVGTRC